jgi:hypothetical protein
MYPIGAKFQLQAGQLAGQIFELRGVSDDGHVTLNYEDGKAVCSMRLTWPEVGATFAAIVGDFCPTNTTRPKRGDRVVLTFDAQEYEVCKVEGASFTARSEAGQSLSHHIRHLRQINDRPTGVERSSDVVRLPSAIPVAAVKPTQSNVLGAPLTPVYAAGDRVYQEPSSEQRRAESLHDQLAALERERDRIRAEGAIAPNGCWIEIAPCYQRNVRQVFYRSRKAIFEPARKKAVDSGAKVKRRYIGMVGSAEEKEAHAAIERRNRLNVVLVQIEKLEETIDESNSI